MDFLENVKQVASDFEDKGMYLQVASATVMPVQGVITDDLFEKLVNGDIPVDEALRQDIVNIFFTFEFQINDIVWTDRFLKPEQTAIDHDFDMIMPDESDPDYIRNMVRRVLRDE